jgi:hypothetical protein
MKNFSQTPINAMVRNTTPINSNSYNIDGYQQKSLVLLNGLDQAVNVQVQYSPDNVTFYPIGSPINIAASKNDVFIDTTVPALRLVRGWLKFTATAAVAPTTGTFKMELQLNLGN